MRAATRRLIAAAALAGSLAAGALGVVGSTPASAAVHAYGDKGIGIDFNHQAEQLMLLNAYVYGINTGAWVTCAEMGTGGGTPSADCVWMIGPYYYYSWNIIEWWTTAGYTVEFRWNVPFNQYTGYVEWPG